MKYTSTRGGVREVSFQQALFSSYAPDGGLYLPERIPKVPRETLQQWSKLTYPELVRRILPLFISEEEIPHADLEEIDGQTLEYYCCAPQFMVLMELVGVSFVLMEGLDSTFVTGIIERALSRFATSSVVELARLKDDLNILELWHGPTMAFKDLALSCVGQLLEYFLDKRQEHVTILVGTSGDTGSAAIESVRGFRWADIVVLLPKGRCSRTQELQMTTVIEDNVHVFRVDGTSDDLDVPIKSVFMDRDFAEKNHVISINSINWARIMVQIVHYFYGYFQMCPEVGETLEVAVPTGACGNVTSGLIARSMGLPIRLVTTVNSNDIVARTVSKGDFSVTPAVIPTIAPAMDIQLPYNMERLFYLLTDGDTRQVAALMDDMEVNRRIVVPKVIHEKMQECFATCSVDDAGIRAAMARCWEVNRYMPCPHTAVAVKYHYDNKTPMKRLCLATASPAKFEEAILSAGLPPQPAPTLTSLRDLPTRYMDMRSGEDWEQTTRDVIRNISARWAA